MSQDQSEKPPSESRHQLFQVIREDLNSDPPNTEHIAKVIDELIEALCKFVPSKTTLHEKIKNDIYHEEITVETMPNIIYGLINWIEQFQCPVDDAVTRKWKSDFQNATDYLEFIVNFLAEYYDHSEKVYRQLWEARKRVLSGEDVVPPEHRKKVEGVNGVPTKIKTAR